MKYFIQNSDSFVFGKDRYNKLPIINYQQYNISLSNRIVEL